MDELALMAIVRALRTIENTILAQSHRSDSTIVLQQSLLYGLGADGVMLQEMGIVS